MLIPYRSDIMNKYIFLFLIMAITNINNAQVQVTAHRGASGLAPENTLAAINLSIELKSDWCEIDVQETSDGIIVLLHDKLLKRTAGVWKNIWDTTYDEVKTLDAGSWFDKKFAGEPIPKLDSIIDTVNGKLKLNIELKLNGHEVALPERVVEIIESKKFVNECIVTSFSKEAINKIKKINPEIKTGFIFDKRSLIKEAFKYPCEILSVNYKLVDKEFVNKANANGKEVHVWTVNDEIVMKELIAVGVDNIITNRPDILVKILR